jgi:hypothetical protein
MERMRPEVDLLEHLSVDGHVPLVVAMRVLQNDVGRLRRVVSALLTNGAAELAENREAPSSMPEWRWRELLRDDRFWGDPVSASKMELRSTPETLATYRRDSRRFFERLFGRM